MNMKEIIGLRRRPQMIAAGIYIVALVSVFLPFASVGGTTVTGLSAALSLGGLHLAGLILVALTAVMGIFLLVKPSVKGARLWAAFGALETAAVTIELFATKMLIDPSGLLPGSFLVKNFGIGYWLLLITAFVGLYYAMAATKLSVGYIVLALMTVVWLFPILWIVLTSFRGESGYYVGYFIPKTFTLDNYLNLFKEDGPLPFARWWLNTFFVASISCVLNTLIVLITSFVLSRQRFQGRTLLMKAMMVIGMFPGFMSMIAVYNIQIQGFMDTVPKAMDEAARIDGATNFTIFYKIMIPMAKPIVIYQLMSAFMGPWGDYIFPSLLLGDKQASYTVAIGLKWLTDQQRIETYYTQFAAGAVLVSVPIVILFSMLQRYYVEGMSGAVKG